jgi:GTPase SAR1 family protein
MPSFFRGAHAAIVVFDVTKKATFDNLKRWMSDLNRAYPPLASDAQPA